MVLGLRPEDFTNTWTEESRDGSGVVPLDVAVEIAEPLGSDTLVFSRLGASEIVGRLSATAAPAVGVADPPECAPQPHAPFRCGHRFNPLTIAGGSFWERRPGATTSSGGGQGSSLFIKLMLELGMWTPGDSANVLKQQILLFLAADMLGDVAANAPIFLKLIR